MIKRLIEIIIDSIQPIYDIDYRVDKWFSNLTDEDYNNMIISCKHEVIIKGVFIWEGNQVILKGGKTKINYN